MEHVFSQYCYQGVIWGGGEGTSVEILFEISPECRNTFLPKSRIFRKFSRYFYTITPKITFYCIFINKFHKNFEKSAQKFFAAPSAPKTCRNISIFSPLVCRWTPPRGVTPQKNHPDWEYLPQPVVDIVQFQDVADWNMHSQLGWSRC